MSWIAVDTGLGNHHKMAHLPSDAARWGWLLTLCEAKEQRKPGTFASEVHFRYVLARHGKYLPDYIKAGLLDKSEDGTLTVHDWQKHQWAAAKAAQREDIPKTPLGHSEDIPKTIEGQKEDASRAVSVPVLVDVTTEGVQGEPFPAIDAEAQTFLEGITHRLIRQAGDKQLAEYDRQIADHGLAAVISAYQRCAKAIRGTPTATQLVWSGRKILEPFVDPSEVADAEKGQRPRAIRPPRDEAAIRAERLRLIEPGATA